MICGFILDEARERNLLGHKIISHVLQENDPILIQGHQTTISLVQDIRSSIISQKAAQVSMDGLMVVPLSP